MSMNTSEYKEGQRVIVRLSDAEPQTGTIVWVQPEYSAVGIKLDRSGRIVSSLVYYVSPAVD